MKTILSASLNKSLFSLIGNQSAIAGAQSRLSSGLKVNSALDNPAAFFASQSLTSRVSDLNLIHDKINQSLLNIQTADLGLQAIENLLDQAETTSKDAIENSLFATQTNSQSINEQILALDPVGYWRLNETSGTVAENLGSGGSAINAVYQNGVGLGSESLFSNGGDTSAQFDGSNDRIIIPNSNLINTSTHSERTIELTFNANDTSKRQVLYEEGAHINALSIYIEDDKIYVNGRDQGDFGPFDISKEISAGETYHVALVLDAPNNEFRGYLDGELIGTGYVNRSLSPHSGGIGIGHVNGQTYFHDGAGGGAVAFDGRIAEVALYNDVISQSQLQSHASSLEPNLNQNNIVNDLNDSLSQIDQTVFSSSYRGVNLLSGGNLEINFNESHTSSTKIDGDNFTLNGLSLENLSLADEDGAKASLEEITRAKDKVREKRRALSVKNNIILSRSDYIENISRVLQEGSDKLILADLEEESAKLLSLRTAQQLGIQALQIASASSKTVLQLF